jgi:Glycosyl transferase family 2
VRIVSTMVVRDEADVVDAQIAFHLNTGVDFVIATDSDSRDGTAEILESYVREGRLQRIQASGPARDSEWRTRMARIAAVDHGADWVISAEADEFWWPRGEGMKDVLAAIPPRYAVVQALVRVFGPRSGDEFFAERMTVRPSLLGPDEENREPIPWALRPMFRADPRIVVAPDDGTESGLRVPLRAWYPIEVLRYPFRSLEQTERTCSRADSRAPRSRIEAAAAEAYGEGSLSEWYESVADEGRVAQGIAVGSLVVDERLRDALRLLRTSAEPSGNSLARRFRLPSETSEHPVLGVPDIVDDAGYAGECAAVGEVDLARLDRQIRALESRIAWLEARFWPRMLRTVTRVVRR